METRTKASLVRRFGVALDTIRVALTDCPEDRWGVSLWHVDPLQMWVNDLWFWARDNDVSIWHTNWSAAARTARGTLAAGGDIKKAMNDAVAAAGTTVPSGLEPPALRPDREIQRVSAFWRVGFHALFHCDLRLHDPDDEFRPPPPFTFEDEDSPTRVLRRADLVNYVDHCHRKAVDTISGLGPDLETKVIGHWNVPFRKGLYVTLSHLNEHGKQMKQAVEGWLSSSAEVGLAGGNRTPDPSQTS